MVLLVVCLLDVLLLVINMSLGVMIAALGLRGTTDYVFLFVVLVFLIGDRIEWILLTLLLSRWLGTGLTLSVLTPVLSHLLTLLLVFDLYRWEAWRTFG